MAKRSFSAIGGNDQSVWRRGGDFDAVTARSSHFALERGVAGGRLPALPRTGLRCAWRVRTRCRSEERDGQGGWTRGLEIFSAGTRRTNPSLGFDGTLRRSPAECEREGTLERRRGESGRRGNRGRGAEIEFARHVPSRWRERTVDGIASGFAGNTGVGLVGLVSRVSSGRSRRCDGGAIFYGWDDLARMAACAGIGRDFEQRRNRKSARFCVAGPNRSAERRPRARGPGDWAGAGCARRRDPGGNGAEAPARA